MSSPEPSKANRRSHLSLAFGLMAALLLAVPAAGAAAAPQCDGEAATIVGTPGDDVLRGTNRADVIHGLGGNDVIIGRAGADIVCGGAGDDTIKSGGGEDRVFGGDGNDTILAGGGADYVAGGDGHDEVNGGGGIDRMFGGPGNDVLVGAAGRDRGVGGPDWDRCSAERVDACEAAVLNFSVTRFLMNQGTPVADSQRAPAKRGRTVVGRPGIARAFVTANAEGIDAPTVHLVATQRNGTKKSYKMTGPAEVPTSPSEGVLGSTYNFKFGAKFIKPGMKLQVVVDRPGETFEISETDNRYPRKGATSIRSTKVPTMKILVVPAEGMTLSDSEAKQLFQGTFDIHPVAARNIKVRAGSYNCQGCIDNPTTFQEWVFNWQTLLQEMGQMANNPATNPQRRMFHAIVPYQWTQSGIAGIGYLGFPAAVSVPLAETVAHETGHNLDLQHILCDGREGDPDPNYPSGPAYQGGKIGGWGYNPYTGETFSPSQYVDLMTYCQPEWISDYSYQKALEYRLALNLDIETVAADSVSTVMSFAGIVSGDMTKETGLDSIPQAAGVDLTPSVAITKAEVVDHAPMAPQPGDHTLVGLDSDGDVVIAVSFRSYEFDHIPGAAFFFSVAVPDTSLERIVSWEVEHEGATVAQRAAG